MSKRGRGRPRGSTLGNKKRVQLVEAMLATKGENLLSREELAREIGTTTSSPAFRREWFGKPEHDYWLVEEALLALHEAYREIVPTSDQVFAFLVCQLWALQGPERNSIARFRQKLAPSCPPHNLLCFQIRIPPNWCDRRTELREFSREHVDILRRAGATRLKAPLTKKKAASFSIALSADTTLASDVVRANARAILAFVRSTGFKLSRRRADNSLDPKDIRLRLSFPDEGDYAPPFGPAVFQEMKQQLDNLSAPLDFQAVPDIDHKKAECLPLAAPSPETEKDEEALRDRVTKGYDLLNAYATAKHQGRKSGKKNRHN